MTDATQSHAASAPGKVLLVGGYLVLDRAYTGLSFGLDARIHVHVQHRPAAQDGVSLQEIEVRSPQFVDAVWKFGYHTVPHDGGIGVTLLDRLVAFPLDILSVACSWSSLFAFRTANRVGERIVQPQSRA